MHGAEKSQKNQEITTENTSTPWANKANTQIKDIWCRLPEYSFRKEPSVTMDAPKWSFTSILAICQIQHEICSNHLCSSHHTDQASVQLPKKKIIRFLHSFSLFFHLTNVDRPTLGPGVVPSVDTVGNTQSPCLHGICHLQRERGALQPPGVMGAVRGGPGARGLEVASSPRHWGSSLPGEEHQNQEVKAGWQG